MMYDELIKSLRQCAEGYCAGCKNDLVQSGCRGLLQHEAADAIEELSAIREEQKAQIILMAAEIEELSAEKAKIENSGKLLAAAFERLKEKVPRWIPVTERLPIGGDDSGAICENVCLLMDDGAVSCGWMNGITKKVYYLNARDDVVIKAPITRVTHWQPLPEPPKEG